MKLLIVTTATQFREQVSELCKKASIESFSGLGIDGYKSSQAQLITSGWFSSEGDGVGSYLFFAFTNREKTDELLRLITDFNHEPETDNPVRMAVTRLEEYV
ncbi:MAG: hypothetical protein MI921_20525 [Cytophagales bacterium]|nr:hypothetical protein [Cytophagales bacterium]